MSNNLRMVLVAALLLFSAGAQPTSPQAPGASKTVVVGKCRVAAFVDADYEEKVHISIVLNGKRIGHRYTIEAPAGRQYVAGDVTASVLEAASKEAGRICR